jgi:hypothetical protein
LNNEQLAEFHGVNLRSTYRWTPETKHRKTIQALAGAEPQITNLIGDINQLAYVFDCQNLQGENQVQWCWINRSAFMLRATIFKGDASVFEAAVNLNSADALPRLLILKKYLMEMVYGNKEPSEVKAD